MAQSASAPPQGGGGDKPLAMTQMVIVGAAKAGSSDEANARTQINRPSVPLDAGALADLADPTNPVEVHADTLPRVGRYVLLRKLGEGAMGVVYAAYDQELDRKVAVKIIHPERQQDAELRARTIREAQALARVNAPNVIHVYQVGEVDGQLFIAMEFVNGTTLSKWQAAPERQWQELLRMYLTTGQGLQAAHEAGLVHRDFKPDNVLIGDDGRPRVADFGLARIQGKAGTFLQSAKLAAIPTPGKAAPVATPLTQLGVVMGTPLYMSPEQHMGEQADSRSDQFSFCVALYEALYKQLPFAGDTVELLAFNSISGNVLPRPSGSHVPMPVHDALLRGLSPSPEQRFPSMRELLAALLFDPSIDPSTNPRERQGVILIMTGFVFMAALGLNLLQLLGVSAEKASLLNSLAFFAVFATLSIRFRKGFVRNSFHRGSLVYGLSYSAHLIGMRLLGIKLGLNVPQLMTLDLLALASSSAMASACVMRGLWPVIPLGLFSSLAAATYQDEAQIIASLAIPVATIIILTVWIRTTVKRVHRRKS
jgi:serine/threonine protein kinase